jgi:hypothetical protein
VNSRSRADGGSEPIDQSHPFLLGTEFTPDGLIVPTPGILLLHSEDGHHVVAPSATSIYNRSANNSEGPKVLLGIVDDSPFQIPVQSLEPHELFQFPRDVPLGFTGPSSVLPSESQQSSHFVPIDDRWRIGFAEWDRYGRGHPILDDYPFQEGSVIDPYNQNLLKGDYPIAGQHTFLRLTLQSKSIFEGRQVPTPTTPFESTRDPLQTEFFGDPDQYFMAQNLVTSFELFHGDASFKPNDWRIKIAPVFNLNHLVADELGIVNPNVLDGQSRFRQDSALEEWFVESKLADLSTDYDFMSVRAGSQFFVSDFRGFIFSDTNRGVRLFGNRLSNREQFNVLWFDQTEKDTNSLLNTLDDRHQNTWIANYYRQDFIWPGYTGQFSFHFNHDRPSFLFDLNDFLVRPDPVGVFAPHDIKAYYFGFTGNGHINRINVSNAFYYVFGQDDLNPLAGQPVDIDAYMAAIELSYDRDWMRFRSSYFFASGDSDITDGKGEGFDAIMDNPAFAGGEFSYWQRQAIRLFGVNLTNRQSLVANLRSSKFQGQTNFCEPWPASGQRGCRCGLDSTVETHLERELHLVRRGERVGAFHVPKWCR